MRSIYRIFFGIFFLAHSVVSFAEDVPVSQIIDLGKQANIVASSALPNASLFMIEGLLDAPAPCAAIYHWYYRYVNFEAQASGAVEFLPTGKDCKLSSKWSSDSVALGMGYYFFDTDKMLFSPVQAAAAALSKHPQFQWNGNLQIYQPLHPTYEHPLYLLPGEGAGKFGSYLVDTVTNEVSED